MRSWYLRRLRAMSWGERRLRTARYLRDIRHRRRFFRRGPEAVTGPPPSAGSFLATWLEAPWVLVPRRLARTAARVPAPWKERTIQEANEILAGRYRWLGDMHDLGPQPDWRREPISGVTFPAAHWTTLRATAPSGGWDLKHLWEPNLHPAFVTLAKAYLYTGQDDYRLHLEHLWKGWMEQNPPLCGPNLLAPVEIGLRLLHWAAALRFLAARHVPEPAFLADVFRSVFFQRFTLADNLSRFSSANNHLLGELASLVLTDAAFPGLAPRVQTDRFERELQQEVLLQFHEDGGNREQAFHYHGFSLAFGLLGIQLGREQGRRWPEPVVGRLRAAARFLAAGLDQLGQPFLYGDSDQSEVLPLAEGTRNPYRSILIHAGGLLDSIGEAGEDISSVVSREVVSPWQDEGIISPEPAREGTSPARIPTEADERAVWLLGDVALAGFPPALRPNPATAVFPESGHAFLRRGPLDIHVNAGNLGYLSIAAHAHADALSVEIRHSGEPVVVDPGTYSYRSGNPWREYLVSSPAHATVTVDGQNQAERLGPFLWGRQYRARLHAEPSISALDSVPAPLPVLAAEHDGYRHLGVLHRRRITLDDEGSVRVDDELRGTGHHRLRLFWPLGPGAAAETDAGVTLTLGRGKARLRVEGLPGRARVVAGDPATPGTPCIAPGYDRLVGSSALLWEGILSLPVSFRTVIEFLEITDRSLPS